MSDRITITYAEYMDGGDCADGGTYVASPEAVAAGHLVNQKVRVLMPDGSELLTTRVLVTPEGMAHFATMFQQEETSGMACIQNGRALGDKDVLVLSGTNFATLRGLIVDVLADGQKDDLRDRMCMEALSILDAAKLEERI